MKKIIKFILSILSTIFGFIYKLLIKPIYKYALKPVGKVAYKYVVYPVYKHVLKPIGKVGYKYVVSPVYIYAIGPIVRVIVIIAKFINKYVIHINNTLDIIKKVLKIVINFVYKYAIKPVITFTIARRTFFFKIVTFIVKFFGKVFSSIGKLIGKFFAYLGIAVYKLLITPIYKLLLGPIVRPAYKYALRPIVKPSYKYVVGPIVRPVYKILLFIYKLMIRVIVLIAKAVYRFILHPIFRVIFYPLLTVLAIFRFLRKFLKKHAGYLFLLPWLIGFLVFTGGPFLYTFYLSFYQVELVTKGFRLTWFGFKNYQTMFTGSIQFLPALINFGLTQLIYVPVILVISFILGLLLNQELKFRAGFRTVFFLPVIILSGSVMQQFMSSGVTNLSGVNDVFVFKIVANYSPFIADAIMILFVNFTLVLWFTGIPIILFINALQKIDRQLFEAAQIDGATWWQILWKIIIPNIKSTALVVSVYTIVNLGLFNINPRNDGIPTIFNLIKNQLGETSNGLGIASAYSTVYSLVVLLFVGIAMFIFREKYKVKKIESLKERQLRNLRRIQQSNMNKELTVAQYFRKIMKRGAGHSGK